MTKHRVAKIVVLLLMCITAALGASAQTFTTLVNFDQSNGGGARSLFQGIDGNIYGIGGGGSNSGTAYFITPDGAMTTLYSFCSKKNCADGVGPTGMVQAANGNLFGTTYAGGANNGSGTVFELSPTGKLTTIYNFCAQTNCADGINPNSGLVQGIDGNFYGTTARGGAKNLGTVFVITPAGQFSTLYSFCSETNCDDGSSPYSGLVLATNGNLYGTTDYGGTNASGTIFEITASGQFLSLYSLDVFNTLPSTLIQAADGSFYGTTESMGSTGSVFRFIPPNNFTVLFTFCSGCAVGSNPVAPVVQGSDGNFYGTTTMGGTRGDGTLFSMTPKGKLTVVHTFCTLTGCADGTEPAPLMQSTNGIFYGSTGGGGEFGEGTLYSVSFGFAPFVESNPVFGPAGRPVRILGNGLTGATSVAFNGTPATFKVVSDTYIQATVPAGATTGTIVVTTPSGTLSSNVAFRIRP